LKKNVYLDAVIYNEVGLRAATQASGEDRIMFGTDHPFFPPLGGEKVWASVGSNLEAINGALGMSKSAAMALGGNALQVLRLGSTE
jgi:aminocarboxymuconate-semialdehyde decarboxylase